MKYLCIKLANKVKSPGEWYFHLCCFDAALSVHSVHLVCSHSFSVSGYTSLSFLRVRSLSNKYSPELVYALRFDCLFISMQCSSSASSVYQIASACEWLVCSLLHSVSFRFIFYFDAVAFGLFYDPCTHSSFQHRWVIYANKYICQYVLRLQVNKFERAWLSGALHSADRFNHYFFSPSPWVHVCVCFVTLWDLCVDDRGHLWAFVVNRTRDLLLQWK